MLRIATITWIRYNNYGTYLQAYALQQTIKKFGCLNEIVDDSFLSQRPNLKGKLVALLSNCLRWVKYYDYIKIEKETAQRYSDFRNKYLSINSEVLPLNHLDSKYDFYVIGSDQIWYPSDEIFNPYYYAAFTVKKKVAYAPSVGTANYPKEFFDRNVRELVERFAHLSIREGEGASKFSEFLGRRIESVLDPTLLLTKEEWKTILRESKPCKEEKYLLCYFLTANEWYIRLAKEYAERQGLKLLIFGNKLEYINVGRCLAAGPIEFVNYIKHCSCMFTDSFHGTVFSILFEKPFRTFQRFADDNNVNQNSRLRNLFAIAGLDGYLIREDEVEKIETLPAPDYVKVNECLSIERKRSLAYLRNALEN